jgi:peptidyl-prolyl cis-trans isomerase SurA
VAVVFLAAVDPLRAAEVVDRILAFVNSRIITQSTLDARAEQTIRDTGGAPPDMKRREEMKKTLMEELVNEALLEDRARDLDLTTADAEVEDQINRLKEANKVTTEEDFARALAASGLTPDRLRDQLRKTLTVQRVVGREVNSKVDLSDDALRLIYEREKDTYRVPEKAHLAEILISKGEDPAETQKKAKEASDLLKGGAKFETVVAQYSDGSTKSRGGDLGIVTKGELTAEIDKAVFSLPVGAVSDPIGTKFGWHLVKVVDKVPPTYKPFSEVRADILKREQETQFQKKLADYLDKLKQEAVIKVAPEALAYYTPPARVSNAVDVITVSQAPGAPGVPVASSGPKGIEITPMGGWRAGGTTSTGDNVYIDSVRILDSLSYGVNLEYPLSKSINVEAFWSHQNTELRASLSGTPAPEGSDPKLSHLNMDTFQIGGLWHSGSASNRSRLYLELLFGASVLTPSPGLTPVTRLSGTVGAGLKLFKNDHLGGRLGLRWMPVYLVSTVHNSCDSPYGCYSYFAANFLSQGDAFAGLILRF